MCTVKCPHFKRIGDYGAASAEDSPCAMLQRRFGGIRTVILRFTVMVDRHAASQQGAGKLPARRNLLRVERARRPARLIDPGFQLHGLPEPAPGLP